jgi:hypothetical protein
MRKNNWKKGWRRRKEKVIEQDHISQTNNFVRSDDGIYEETFIEERRSNLESFVNK